MAWYTLVGIDMRLKTFFIFLPSQELIMAANAMGESDLCEVSVWITHETDRSGLEHSQAELESSFWADFKAKLIYEDESPEQRKFRDHCLRMGFENCWSVVKTTDGGDAKELIETGDEAKEFLKPYSL
jgi:hypothetical protein